MEKQSAGAAERHERVPERAHERAHEQGRRGAVGWLQRSLYVLGLGLVVGLIVHTGPGRILEDLAACDWRLFVLSQVAFFASLLVGGLRWAVLVRAGLPASPAGGIVAVYLTNSLLSGLTPARTGEMFAPLLMRRRCAVPTTLGLAAIVVDRTLDAIALAGLLALTSHYLTTRIAMSPTISSVLSSAAWAVLLLIFLFLGALALTSRALTGRVRADPGESLLGRAKVGLLSVRRGIDLVGRPAALFLAAVLTAATWALQFLYTFWLINAFTEIAFLDSAACHTASAAAGLLSLIPGGLGASTVSYVVLAEEMGYAWQPIASAGVVGIIAAYLLRLAAAAAADVNALRAHRSS